MKPKRSLLRLINRIRRFYLLRFRKSYVKRSLSKRKGECIPNCGACCGDGRCEYLDKNMRCSIYEKRTCHNPLPIDEREKMLFGIEGKCGYYWEKKD